MASDVSAEQEQICRRFGPVPFAADPQLKVGISANVREGVLPLNGLRHLPAGDTTGWYIWAGDMSDDPEFFKALHVSHLAEWCPEVLPYLALPPGWRFLLAPEHEDVWFDESIVHI